MTYNQYTSSAVQQKRPHLSGCLYYAERKNKKQPEFNAESVSLQGKCAELNEWSESIKKDYVIDHEVSGETVAVISSTLI